jgi:hypothetical protein
VSWFKPRDLLDRTFEIGIILKGLDGILETIGGLLQLLVPPASFTHPQQDPRAPPLGATTAIWGGRRITRSCLRWAGTASTPVTSGSAGMSAARYRHPFGQRFGVSKAESWMTLHSEPG